MASNHPIKKVSASPCPVRYCPVEHGDVLFPEITLANLADPEFEAWMHLSLVRKHLCHAFGSAGVPCDPRSCRDALAGIGPNGAGGTVNACKRAWRASYDRQFLQVTPNTDAFDDALTDLGFGSVIE